MAIFKANSENFRQIIDEEFAKKQIVVLKFGSVFCEACSALEMELDQLNHLNKKVSIIYIDCDESSDLAEEYNIYQLPTMIIYKDANSIIYDEAGVILCEDIQKIIDSSL
nr:thioredoxin family protein [uncultured Sulfurimonas sp.]